ncbi:MAG: STAS/SEC14 domain-containing protein [Chloroflexi bacterium]|nr:STAS/SEC14 domain-containing protein [Chloroflexota bacterium]
MNESSGPVIGYKVVGKMTVEDYNQLNPEIQALVEQYDNDVCVLLDLN